MQFPVFVPSDEYLSRLFGNLVEKDKLKVACSQGRLLASEEIAQVCCLTTVFNM